MRTIDQIRAQAAAAIERFQMSSGHPSLLIEIRGLQDRIWKIKMRKQMRECDTAVASWVDTWDPPQEAR